MFTHLAHKHVLIGLTGGIACYKIAELIRRLRDAGATVDVVMTESATQFITPVTLQALSGRPVYMDLWDARPNDNMAHIHLSRDADVILIAPASTNFIAKLAQGLCDDLLSTLCIARGNKALLVAPAMNKEMWAHPATQRNIQCLIQDGVTILGPGCGDQACGEFGDGRMLEAHQLLTALDTHFAPKLLANKQVVITAGPTLEPIDPVRVLTNRSSGKMGYALADAAAKAGAHVTLISGPVALTTPTGVQRINVETAAQMHETVMQHMDQCEVFIAVAAVSDWRVTQPSTQKLKKTTHTEAPILHFSVNPDILAEVAARPQPPYCVGFAAETEHLLEYASQKRQRKGIPLLIANLAQEAMDKDHSQLVLIDDQGSTTWPSQSKQDSAQALISHIAQQLTPSP